MNERIRELSYEAQRYALNNTTGPDLAGLNELWQEKFAELIVRECVSQMEWQKISPKGEGAYNSALDLAQRNIKEHFGVEE